MVNNVLINNLNIAYQVFLPAKLKSNIPIVLLHDSLGCISVWRDFPEKLAQITGQPVWVYDRMGYGQSSSFPDNYRRTQKYLEEEADFLKTFLNKLNLDKVVLFGHSDGGSIALIAAAKYPQKIAAIITEGAHVFVEEVTLNGIREAVKLYQSTDLPAKLTKHHGPKSVAVFKAWTDTWLSPSFKDWNIVYLLRQITCPVLTFYGKKDEYGTLEQASAIEKNCQGFCKTVVIENAAHTPHKETVDIVLNETAQFLTIN